ncbi:MAG: nicotinate-nucleotide diphosphorylase (carboxylating), partial [Halieaceae bacterium]
MISPQYVTETVTRALLEDVGTGDLTASLIDSSALASATIMTREAGILCGMRFASEAFRQTDPACQLDWLLEDGDSLSAGDELCRIQGPA